jgi:superfamily II DNA or RNA helicase
LTNLKNLNLKSVYRTGRDDLYNDFYKISLSVSSSYDRAVGYFSSEILAMSIQGLSQLIRRNGKMRLIIGHPLSNDEFEAVKQGVLLKEITDDLSLKLEQFILDADGRAKNLEFLAWLIACGRLEIKFALRKAGMYHEKIGIFSDLEGNTVVFQGSANETPHGMVSTLNAESISVYKSWEESTFLAYGKEFAEGFQRLWENDEINIVTIDVPSQIYENISNSVKNDVLNIDDLIEIDDYFNVIKIDYEKALPFIPKKIYGKDFKMFDHQRRALDSWKSSGYKGILKLATGSGKTITSIYGAVRIYEAKNKHKQQFFLVVAVPYIELATQWIENLKLFGIFPHQCFDSKTSWSESFERQLDYFNAKVINFLAVVVVNKTLASPLFEKLINNVDPNALMIIGDECHNHGSTKVNSALPNAYYRMGLSATPFRSDEDELDSPFPDESKKRILAYYGDVVAEYSLSDAINDGVLTPYEYYIVPVYLTSTEQDLYEELSQKITSILIKKNSSGISKQDRENLTRYCGQRTRLLGSANNKLVSLQNLTSQVSADEKSHTLFYVGEGKVNGDDEEKVIDQVSDVLKINDWKTSKFTSYENSKNRKDIMSAFKQKEIDALVAMKVLDEGIDIPVCKTAYILASTRNPRQYVQRRGRILRKSDNKTIAKIFDFVILPINNSPASKRLKNAESERINDFASLAVNKMQIERIIDEEGLNYGAN